MKTIFGILTIAALAYACVVEIYFIVLLIKEMEK
jgi:hypothetical protein